MVNNPYLRREEETHYEEELRPSSFDEFIGQTKTVENLKIAIKAAKKRKDSLDHIIFSGLPGLGKTTLARLIAREMGTNLIMTSGPILKRPADIVASLTKLKAGDILFIDEIHRMLTDVEEYLYSAMEDFFITVPIEKGIHGRTINLELKKFTLIGATTREGLLSEPFRSRFGIIERLVFYPAEEIEKIIIRSARILSVQVDKEAARILADRSRGTPRIANRYLKRVRDLAQVKSNNRISIKIAEEGLKMLGVDEIGLEKIDREILQTILNNDGQPVGLKTISQAVNEAENTIEEVYEPFLVRENFIVKTPRGRKITAKAVQHLGKKPQGSLF